MTKSKISVVAEIIFLFVSLQVSAQRDLITNFATAQATKLGTLSTDTTNLLANCRTSVDAGVSKNIAIAESISKLLDEWKSNNDEMKTIGSDISTAIDIVITGTNEQIDETVKINEEHEKRSDEHKSKLVLVTDDIKEQSEKNKNEITRIIESANNHTKIFAATLKTWKFKICEEFEKQKQVAATAFTNIKSEIVEGIKNTKASSTDIANDIECADKNIKENAQHSLTFKNNFSSIVQQYGESSKQKLDSCRNKVNDFHRKDLKVYSSSGKNTIII